LSASQKSEVSGKNLPEGVFLPTIDYNMLIWMALQNCVNVTIFGHNPVDFYNTVRILDSLVLPDWKDSQYVKDTDADNSPIGFYKAIVNLLHRRGFFDTNRMDAGHL